MARIRALAHEGLRSWSTGTLAGPAFGAGSHMALENLRRPLGLPGGPSVLKEGYIQSPQNSGWKACFSSFKQKAVVFPQTPGWREAESALA